MIDKLPYRMIHISQTSHGLRALYLYPKWTIEAWRGEVTRFSNILNRTTTLASVKGILDALPDISVTDQTTITIMIGSVMHRVATDDDWVMLILQESI